VSEFVKRDSAQAGLACEFDEVVGERVGFHGPTTNIIAYPDPEIRLAIERAAAKESSRGMKISKEKVIHKIDVVVALTMAAFGAMQYEMIPRGKILYFKRLSQEFERN
jgi:hypothetical protein